MIISEIIFYNKNVVVVVDNNYRDVRGAYPIYLL